MAGRRVIFVIIAYHAAMALPKKTLYQILGVSQDATSIDIGLAHEKKSVELANAMPPDPSGVALVKQAYEILSNPHRRAAYDAQLVTAAEKLAAQQQAPDLELEDETGDDERGRKMRLLGMVGVMALVLVALFFVFRPRTPPPPAVEPVAEAPKPLPPPPPKLRTGAEILFDFNTSGGQILSYSMSGSATPVGVALEVEVGQMITTCHALPAGEKLVVKVAGQMQAAELTIVDEQLDLCRLLAPGFTTPPLKVAAEDARAGDKIFAIVPNPKGEFAATEGTVTQVRTTALGKVLEVSMPIAANGSGGGIFNEYGKLVGIATSPHQFGQGLNIALPVSWIAQMRSRTTPPK
jgi:S1-C subfamily serine protease